MLTRVLKTAAAVLSHTFEVGETPTDSTGPVTVAVTGPNGEAVTSGAATHGTVGVYRFALAGQPALTTLTLAWSATIAGAAVVEVDQVEIVGGFLFTLREGRGSDAALSDTDRYPGADLIDKRLEVEEEVEEICSRAFVPRYRRVVLDGSGSPDLVLPDSEIRTIRSATVAERFGQAAVALTAGQLAALAVRPDGTLRRTDGLWWTVGYQNVVVEYEHGLAAPPRDLVQATLTRFRTRLTMKNSNVPDRASSFTSQDGGTYRLDLPGAFKTGIPEVDAVYSRYSRRTGTGTGQGGRPIPAGRTLSYDPQYNSLMHPGRR